MDRGVTAFIDDIIVYTKTLEEHIELVQWVLQKLADNKLRANLDKCEFHASQVVFCGYVVGREGITMAEEKVQEVLQWPTPRTKKEVQSFLGFANFYRRFIKDYSKVTRPLHELTTDRVLWEWNEMCKIAFNTLKSKFGQRPILATFDPSLPKMIETDASDLAIGAVLSQFEHKKWYLLDCISRKFQPAELNYDVHDKEMVSIVYCFKK